MRLHFGGKALLYEAATYHFGFVGATGSGKTILIRLLMETVLGIATKDKVPTRMLVYDSKRDMMPVLHGIFERLGRDDATQKITLLNPFDKRGLAWDVAEDIREPAHAQELASIIIPEDQNTKDPFFPNAARLIIESVILSFIEATPNAWTFRDVCNAVETRASIEAVLNRSLRTNWVMEALFGEPKTTANILATLAAAMRPYRIIAALWHSAVKKHKRPQASLHEWLASSDGILVLGNSPTSRTAIDAVNQLLFRRLSQIILEEQGEIDLETDPRRVWVILDEFVRAGKLKGAVELATEGRSKGVSFVIGFQDINGLRAVYGKEIAEEIVGQCTSVALLRMNSPETSEWASRIVGQYRGKDVVIQQNEGDTIGKEHSHNRGTTTQAQIVDRPTLLPSHFQRLKPISKEKRQGLQGVFCSPFYVTDGFEVREDAERLTYDWLFTDGNLWPKAGSVSGFERCNPVDQYLEPWSDEKDENGQNDWERLKLKSARKAQSEQRENLKDKALEAVERAGRRIGRESILADSEARAALKRRGIEIDE